MPSNYGPYQPWTGFTTPNVGGATGSTQDLGERYITKDYLLDVYPNIASATGNRKAPGLWGWGFNTQGQIGNSTLVAYSSPVQVGTLPHWKQVGAQFHTLAIKTDGTLWAWGINFIDGRLGFNTLTNLSYSSPTQVGALTNWKYVGHQGDHSMAIKTDGTLWTWGANQFGQCGHNNRTNYSSPTQVGALTNWRFVDGGYYLTLAIKTDGTLWSWGRNSFGALGNGNTTYYSSPIQVGSLTNWKQISAGGATSSFAVKTDGTLWAWGLNSLGQLGIGNTTNYSSPIQVGSLTNWKQVVTSPSVTDVLASATHTLAVTTEGTLWAWGLNSFGQLGQGFSSATSYYSSPIQVGSLTNWKYAAACINSSYAIKTDGTIWAWGQGSSGRLGLNTISNYSSPVQIGSLTNWKSIISGHQTVFGILDGYI